MSLKHIALLSAATGGGVQRSMVDIASGLVDRGLQVDFVLPEAKGPFLPRLPSEVRVVDLRTRNPLLVLLTLANYLRKARPDALLSAAQHINVAALLARKLVRVPVRTVVMQRIHLSTLAQNDGRATIRLMPYLVRKLYPRADGIAANSKGVADDLAQVIGVPEERIQVIYPSVVTADLFERAQAPVDHPWFCQGQPRIVLGAGNLIKQKDFPTLIRAFAKIRHTHQVRLVILGEGKERPQLSGLIQDLGLEEDVVLLGFVDNPYAYMARAAVFVLSSAWEGFGRVLVEAMAVGTPVVSTNCPSGPAEILEGGKHGPLVPVGDSQALAKAIVNILDNPPSSVVLKGRASDFSLQAVVDSCLEMLQLEDLEVGKV